MSTSHDQILELLDGELDSTAEPSLFAELASSADLRNEFKQQLAIRTAVQQDRMALLPPAALTGAVFTGLGFAAPIAGAAAGAAGGSAIASWIAKVGVPLLSAAAAAGITFVATQQDAPVQTQSSVRPTVATASATATTTDAPTTSAGASAAGSARADDAGRIAAERRAADATNAYLRAERENERLRAMLAEAEQRVPTQNIETSMSAPLATSMTTTFESRSVSSLTVVNDIRIARDASHRAINTAMYTEQAQDWQRFPAFSLQARGFSLTPTATVSVPAQSSFTDNIGLSMLYQLSDAHGIGMEFGSETFAQVFQGTRNGQLIRYEQQPSASWAGIFYRYQHTPLIEHLRPFAQTLVGGSRFGPVGRATIGFTYAPAGPLTFLMGVEGSMMAFNFQNTWFTSTNLGLTYGVALRF